jgi:hypothetical protein
MAGFQHEIDVLHDQALVARRHDADGLHRKALRGALQQHLRRPRRDGFEQPVEALPAVPRGDKTLPVRDRQIDRRQRPGAQDRTRDDDAGGGFLMNHQIGADREHGRLQGHAHNLGDRAKPARDVAGALVARQIFFVGLGPAPCQAARHAHCDQHSALRRLLVARSLRRPASVSASRAGRRDMNSVIRVRVTRMTAPTKAVTPISQWKAKQIAR